MKLLVNENEMGVENPSFYASYNCVPSHKLRKYFVLGQPHSDVSLLSVYKLSYITECIFDVSKTNIFLTMQIAMECGKN